MALKGDSSGLACLFWARAQPLGSGPSRPYGLASAHEGVSPLSVAPHTVPSPARPAGLCLVARQRAPAPARRPGQWRGGEGILEPPGKERSESSPGGGGVGKRGSWQRGGERPGSRWPAGTAGLLARGKSPSCLGGSGRTWQGEEWPGARKQPPAQDRSPGDAAARPPRRELGWVSRRPAVLRGRGGNPEGTGPEGRPVHRPLPPGVVLALEVPGG